MNKIFSLLESLFGCPNVLGAWLVLDAQQVLKTHLKIAYGEAGRLVLVRTTDSKYDLEIRLCHSLPRRRKSDDPPILVIF